MDGGEASKRFSLERVRVALVQKYFYVISLSLPIHGSEQRKVSVQELAIDFLKEGLVDWKDGAEVLRS